MDTKWVKWNMDVEFRQMTRPGEALIVGTAAFDMDSRPVVSSCVKMESMSSRVRGALELGIPSGLA